MLALLALARIVQCSALWSVFQVDNSSQYNLNVYIGTPPQPLTVSLDYGTADLVVVPERCYQGLCSQYMPRTAFNLSASETLTMNKSFFTTELLSGTSISGFWVEDVVQINDFSNNHTRFAIRADTNDQYYAAVNFTTTTKVKNTLGIGPRGLQASVQWTENKLPRPVYDNLLYSLPNISSHSFSVWVDPEESDYGLVIFGGMDPDLFDSSTYTTLPLALLKDRLGSYLLEPTQLSVELNTIELGFIDPISGQWDSRLIGNYTEGDGMLAVLDSKSSLSMPTDVLMSIAILLNATYSYSLDAYLVSCQAQAVIHMALNNYTLEFSISEHLQPQNITDLEGTPMCSLDISVSGSVFLPNTVLKHYFIAVDYDTNEISFAKPLPGVPGSSPQNIVPLSSQGASTTQGFSIYTRSTVHVQLPTFNSAMSSEYELTSAAQLTSAPTSYDI